MSDLKNWAADADLNVANCPNGWPEGMPPSDVNNSAREMMAALRRSYVRQPWYAPGGAITRVSDTTITIVDDSKVTNYSNFYTVGARVRVETTDDYVTGFISGSSYEAPTSTITFTLDASATLPATITDVYVGLSPEDVQGVAGPNLLGCVLGFSSASDKIGAGLLLANGEKFSPSLYPDLAQLYYVSENTYKYGQELVGDVYWPLMPVIKPDEMASVMINKRPPDWSSDSATAMTPPFTAPSDGVVSFMLPIRMNGYIAIGDKTYNFSYDYNYTQPTLFSAVVKEGTVISFYGVAAADFLAYENGVDPGNFSDLYGVVVAYGGVVSAGLADVTELETFCTAERVRAEDAADAASRSADDASDFAIAASGHSTAASNSATLAQQWATKTDGLVASTDYSAKYYAGQSSTSASSASSSADLAHAWATSSTVVESGQYGASYYALRAANYASGAETARDTARNWATKTDGPVADSNYSAKYYANQASTSATSAGNSAAQAAAIVAQLGNVLTYKGSVATYADLSATGNKTGDVWNVLSDGKNYAWDGTAWDDFGGAVTVALSACTDVLVSSLQNGQVLIYNSVSGKWENGTLDALPSQTGQSGKYLTTDGTNASWAEIDALPSQTGQSGKYLTTDGTNTSWADVSGGSVTLDDIARAGDGIKFVGGGGTEHDANYVDFDTPVVINDGVLSSGTITPTILFAPQNWETWEFYVKIKTGNTVSPGDALFAPSTWTRLIYVAINGSGRIQFLASNFNSWIGGDHNGTLTVQPNTTYFMKIGTNGSNFYLKYSTDDINWTTDISFSTENKKVGNYENVSLKIDSMGGENYLYDMTLTADGVVVWTPYIDNTKPAISVDVKTSANAPTSSTKGYVGELYVTTGGAVYICTGVSGSTYTWAQITVS